MFSKELEEDIKKLASQYNMSFDDAAHICVKNLFKKEFKKLIDNLSKHIDREEVVYALSVMLNVK